ncbi:MAG: sensor histidine kinase, partial [Candidatus Kapaibacterium sp.]
LRKSIGFVEDYGAWVVATVLVAYLLFRMLGYRRLLRDILEQPSSGISFVVDRNLRLRRINRRGRELFAMDAETPLRRSLSFYCHDETQFAIERFVASALVARSFRTYGHLVPSGGDEQEILFSAQPLFGLSGSFNGLVVTGVDITEQLERKRLVNWAQLAHDMQTNLSVIRLNAEQMPTDGASATFLDQRRRIIHQSRLLLQRVRDIVSIGRDDVLHAEETDVRELFAGVVREFDDTSFGDIRFVVPTKPLHISIDAPKLSRALRNAVENAIRALPEKKGTIELGVRVSTDRVSLFVRDNGTGMDEQTKANFFRPYFSNYRQYGGTGIGTMIMQRAVALHRGHLSLESEPGVGTTVFFHLPRSVHAG